MVYDEDMHPRVATRLDYPSPGPCLPLSPDRVWKIKYIWSPPPPSLTLLRLRLPSP